MKKDRTKELVLTICVKQMYIQLVLCLMSYNTALICYISSPFTDFFSFSQHKLQIIEYFATNTRYTKHNSYLIWKTSNICFLHFHSIDTNAEIPQKLLKNHARETLYLHQVTVLCMLFPRHLIGESCSACLEDRFLYRPFTAT